MTNDDETNSSPAIMAKLGRLIRLISHIIRVIVNSVSKTAGSRNDMADRPNRLMLRHCNRDHGRLTNEPSPSRSDAIEILELATADLISAFDTPDGKFQKRYTQIKAASKAKMMLANR